MADKQRILVCDYFPEEGILKLKSKGFDVVYSPTIEKNELVKAVAEFDALVVRSRTKVTREAIFAGRRLKLVARAGVGVDNIDVDAAQARGIKIINAPEALANSVAELILGFMIVLARRLCEANASMKQGKWLKNQFVGIELKGKVLGIVGLGRIGRRTGSLAKAFGMELMGYDAVPIPKEVVEELKVKITDMDTLLRRSDFVTLHVPFTEETHHLIDDARLGAMKKTAFLINASRGGVVDETALAKALKEGRIAGAALDVFDAEPPGESELVKLPNVICSPHVGGQTEDSQRHMAMDLVEKLFENLSVPGYV